MRSYSQEPPSLIGGELCLDFANTVTYRGDEKDCGERLTSFDELLTWAIAAGALDRKQATSVAASARSNPEKSAEVLAEAIMLREAVARLVMGQSRSALTADLAAVNRVLQESPQRAALCRQGNGFEWQEKGGSVDLLRLVLIKIARSAANILTSGKLDRVRACGDARCGWLFLDNSRTGKRRWCDMKTCGNRAKARVHQKRARGRTGSKARSRSAR